MVLPFWKIVWIFWKKKNIEIPCLTLSWPSSFSWYKSKKNESIHSQKNLDMNVYSRVIHISQKVEITQKAIYFCLHNRILSSNWKEWSTFMWYNRGKPWKLYAKWKETITRDHTLYGSFLLKSRIWNSVISECRPGCLELAEPWGNAEWMLIDKGFLMGDENVLTLNCGDVYTTLCIH